MGRPYRTGNSRSDGLWSGIRGRGTAGTGRREGTSRTVRAGDIGRCRGSARSGGSRIPGSVRTGISSSLFRGSAGRRGARICRTCVAVFFPRPGYRQVLTRTS